MRAQVLGQTYLEENRLEEAAQEFAKVVRLAPEQAAGYANLALVSLQLGRYDQAARRVREAMQLKPDDPEIVLILATVYQLTGRTDEAQDLLEGLLRRAPGEVRALYALATLALERDDDSSRQRAAAWLEQLVGRAPANVAARITLADVLLRLGQADSAAGHLEEVQRQLPEIPAESKRFFDDALRAARRSDAAAALPALRRFQAFLAVTPFYQAKIRELWGPPGERVGVPTIALSPLPLRFRDRRAVLAAIRFSDATADAGLAGIAGAAGGQALAAGDYDGDGDEDLYLSRGSGGVLLRNESGRFTEVASGADAGGLGTLQGATFADYDNDGHLDLYVAGTERGELFRNLGDGRFRAVTRAAGLSQAPAARRAVFADFDHDGDLDLLLATDQGTRFYRNNGDGSFSDQTAASGLGGGPQASGNAAFGDFDDDADLDAVVAGDSGVVLFRNLRGGKFEPGSLPGGLSATGRVEAVTAADYDNDGFLDMVAAGAAPGSVRAYRNRGDGTFEADRRPQAAWALLAGVRVGEVEFFDFDNDGWLDLLLVGAASRPEAPGVFLFHNEGRGRFSDRSSILPAPARTARRAVVTDYDADGDLDLVLLGADGRLRVLRNDGGNAAPYLDVRLMGLRAGSGKNNRFGIGAKIEVRAGDLYQMRLATQPVTHIGLGEHLKADVVRIRWTNGVYQDLFYPGKDQDVVERQLLKGSCAFLYVWDGTRFRFVTDLMWRSALGMPLGIMAGGSAYAPAAASQEYLRISGDLLKPRDDAYELKITEELWETAYLDEVKLVAVDHPDSVDVYVDERFVPPGPSSLRLYQVSRLQAPRAARDDEGNDLLAAIREQDDVYAAMLVPGPYQGTTALHDLVLDLGPLPPGERTLLVLTGWIFPTDASINVALSQSARYRTLPPVLEVPDGRGGWRTLLGDLSFPAGKNKTVVADLTGTLRGPDHRVRIRTNMEVYWDRIAVAAGPASAPVRLTALEPAAARLWRRGFSRMYRKGGRYGPHWFDYDQVSQESPWGPIAGAFTRYGEVRALLQRSDDMYAIMGPADETALRFDARHLPDLPPGWRRDFLIYTDGWIKDADLNTATGDRVDPLPFHAMSRYPYGPEESYPTDPAHRRYLAEYNTRVAGSRPR